MKYIRFNEILDAMNYIGHNSAGDRREDSDEILDEINYIRHDEILGYHEIHQKQ